MGNQEWVKLLSIQSLDLFLTTILPNSVVGLGYEEEFGSYRRTVQHAL